jgi:fatty-acyl-CoA synthase
LAGVVLVTINPAYTSRELEYVLRQAEVTGVFHSESHRDTDMTSAVAAARAAIPEIAHTCSLSDWNRFLSEAPADTELPDVGPDDIAQIQFTSGTTGYPKGVLIHHRGMVNSARFVAQRAGFEDGYVSINAMPLFHIGGCGTMELGTFGSRGTYVLAPAFEPGHVLELIEIYQGAVTLAVPTMLLALLDHPDRGGRDLSSLAAVVSGGAVVPAELVRRVKDAFGCVFTITYGQTETCGPITETAPTDAVQEQSDTVGKALPHAEIQILDLGSGEPAPIDVPGEVCFRGPQVMAGYFGQPEETASALDRDGWLHSGDIGSMDSAGYITITGRMKDIINRGGEKVYPREVEDVLFDHPQIADVAVLGVPDAKWGEAVVAVLRIREDAGVPSTRNLTEFCRERLARYKTPVRWFAAEQFPQTPSGKIQKFALRDMISRRDDLDGPLVPLIDESEAQTD